MLHNVMNDGKNGGKPLKILYMGWGQLYKTLNYYLATQKVVKW